MITFTAQTQTGSTVYYAWTSDSAPNGPFYFYLDAQLVATLTTPFYTLALTPGEQVQVEVLDTTAAPTPAYPSRAILSWYAPTSGNAAAQYRIDAYIAAAWVQQTLIVPLPGQNYFEWRTPVLADQSTTIYRIVPIGANGNQGPALTRTVYIVRRPDPPSVKWTLNQLTGTVTCSAA